MTEEGYEYAYAFSLRGSMYGPTVDRFADVSMMFGNTEEEWQQLKEAYKNMGMPDAYDELAQQEAAILALMVRVTFARGEAYGPYLLKTQEPMEPETVIQLIQSKHHDGTLKEFLKAAKM